MLLFRALNHRPFAFLWGGQTISRLGDSLYRIVLAWWVLEKTGSATAMGTVLVFTSVPMLVFLLVGGIAVDRFSRPRLMLASDLLRGLAVLLVAFLAWSERLEIWHVYFLSALFGLVDAFFQPAYTALVPEITPLEYLTSANSLTSLSGQLTGVAGPALGAAIVALGGTAIAFALNGLSFFISALCLVGVLRQPAVPIRSGGTAHPWHDLQEGLATVLNTPWLWITIAIAALANFTLAGPLGVALPFLVKNHLHADVGVLGLFNSCLSAGSILAAIWLGRFARLRRRGLLGYGAWVTSGVALIVLGLPVPLVLVYLVAAVIGACLSIFGLVWTISVQEIVPRERLGRVASIDMLGSYVFLPLGYGVTGWLTDRLSAPFVFILGGISTAVLAALGLFHPAIRRYDE